MLWHLSPLIDEHYDVATVYQLCYADAASALSCLNQLRKWWDGITTIGKRCYFSNASKSVLLVKEEFYESL